jgi:hypothetical protein
VSEKVGYPVAWLPTLNLPDVEWLGLVLQCRSAAGCARLLGPVLPNPGDDTSGTFRGMPVYDTSSQVYPRFNPELYLFAAPHIQVNAASSVDSAANLPSLFATARRLKKWYRKWAFGRAPRGPIGGPRPLNAETVESYERAVRAVHARLGSAPVLQVAMEMGYSNSTLADGLQKGLLPRPDTLTK